MAGVTVTLPQYGQHLAGPRTIAHEAATEFAPVLHEQVGVTLEVYKGAKLLAAYAPGQWASAVLS